MRDCKYGDGGGSLGGGDWGGGDGVGVRGGNKGGIGDNVR